MKRWVFNITAVLSLLLLLATVGLWVDSYFFDGQIGYESSTYAVVGMSESSLCALIVYRYEFSANGWHASHRVNDIPGYTDLESGSGFMGFGGIWNQTYHRAKIYGFVTPHWFLTLIFTTLPAIWLYKWNKRRKLGPNACPACGYDLTANESGVCPECGVSAESASDPA